MSSMPITREQWPALPLERWKDTRATLHMWSQVVGKICLALTPRSNHFWNIAFQITPRGLVTPTMHTGDRTFTIAFDFVAHQLVFQISDGTVKTMALQPETVADFYRRTMAALRELEIDVHIWPMPVEIPDPIRFDQDVIHHSYDRDWANAFLRTLLAIKPVFEDFRCDFVGKCSPLHFFWGSFDLAVSRFSGRRAPERPDADPVTQESYSHEVISHGFWPGSAVGEDAAFYAYAAPEPPGFKTAPILPAAAVYNTKFSIFVLPYETVRESDNPADTLKTFLNSTYDAAAALAHWDRVELERR
jgi:hypothetical protein